MFKKLIKLCISFGTLSTILVSNINSTAAMSKIYYSDAVKKVNDVRAKIDSAIDNLIEISMGIDRYRDALNGNDDSTNYECYTSAKYYVLQNLDCHSSYNSSWGATTNCAKSCIYRLFDEEIVLIPYNMSKISASIRYVITSWAGNSWETMEGWFKDSSVDKHPVSKNFGSKSFRIGKLSDEKKQIELKGRIRMEKPNASIYMNVEIESSEMGSIIEEREYMGGHTGWVVFDSYLLRGVISYNITDQSREKLQNLKLRIANLKSELKNEMSKLNDYDPNLDRGNDNYETSNLKQILDNCEQIYIKASNFINLKNNNGWIQKF